MPGPIRRVLAVLILPVLVLSCAAAAALADGPSRIRVSGGAADEEVRIEIDSVGGRVAWADVVCGLARARGFDDGALAGVLPDESLDLRRVRTRLGLVVADAALGRGIGFDVERSQDVPGERVLQITLDSRAMLESERRFKRRLRGISLWALDKLDVDRPGHDFGLEADEGWQEAPLDKRLVVLAHGLDARPEENEDLLDDVRKLDLPAAIFRYPNDQAIEDSARLLAEELADVARRQPGRKVALVTTSMGGLVARAVVENPDLDPGNVVRLVMVAPPNHGSTLARFRFGLEVWEHVVEQRDRDWAERMYASIEDGLAGAADDLRPGSPALERLNARERNPSVRYTIFLGTGAALTERDLAQLRAQVRKAGRRNRFARFFGPKLDELLGDMDEVVRGKGDGAVSVARGKLAGVEDTVILDFSHGRLWRERGSADARKLKKGILARLVD